MEKKMGKINELFESELKVVNLGLESFKDSVQAQGVEALHVDWKPPAGGNNKIIAMLDKLNKLSIKEKIDRANKKAAELIINAQPVLIDIMPASEVIPGMEKKTILHAGPPISWDRMCGPVKGAVMGALIYEGLAKDLIEAEKLAASGEISFDPCHHHRTVGPMAGVVSYSMYVYVVKNKTDGNIAY
jgi:hypothetical protein